LKNSNYDEEVFFSFEIKIPPSQPSPTGEGVESKAFPLGGNGKGGLSQLVSY